MTELVTQLGHDDGLDKVMAQKASSPHLTAVNVADALTDVRPNAVVLEKSGQAERDLALTESGAWASLAAKMHGEKQL
eukprot:1787518-Pyramimonas_sp.AAC.1